MAYHAEAFEIRNPANDEDPMPVLHKTITAMVTRGTDLSARQLGVFLTVYLEPGPHTVRDLSARFGICKPAVSRALDRLGELDLVRRRLDPQDRRSVQAQRTGAGWRLLGELRTAIDRDSGGAGAWGGAAPRGASRAWPKEVVTHRNGYGHGFAANVAAD